MKLLNTISILKRWNKDVFGHYQTMIKELSKRIAEVQNRLMRKESAMLEARFQGELNEWLTRNKALCMEAETLGIMVKGRGH
jgi:hypothetical protein